jgi:hypothetical protein
MKIISSANFIQDKLVAEAVFDALADGFQSIWKSTASSAMQDEAELAEQLRALFFQPRYLNSGETLRTKRAQAISQLARLNWGSLAQSVLESRLEDEIASEPIESVRKELMEAQALIRK